MRVKFKIVEGNLKLSKAKIDKIVKDSFKGKDGKKWIKDLKILAKM